MRAIALALIAVLAAAPFGARAAPYVLDKSHAHVQFSASHLGFSMVQGAFRDFEAEIDFDPGNVEATRVRFTIDAASVETFWEARDKDLRSKHFLDVQNHPYITFASTAVVPTGANTAEITGDLTILGVTRPITAEARLVKLAPSPFNRKIIVAGFEVTGEIDRTEFGMTWAAPGIGARVPFKVILEINSTN